mmetsp:Transcript_23672/g.21038  ORF Transcript_23672/g.21038 Transcript_23672/m.21038 type:complete len:149 (-) Transcript_23672:46-492(-)|eukprot:CAMPEP_0205806790 /NCGR_PEP_ID=MMETSP0205-20121125/10423_1 /ASSEMBLY_ACC=CAM_ASM_000278 /TAXON_ID=36767 /ORGANISM="Euplotes focardii, Strain TN1" /LENGTH=148 /DNA_ID=CAMNT_0053080179 /DNA_START=13 /DNA_END=459 /DNA_ORIENTATION=-
MKVCLIALLALLLILTEAKIGDPKLRRGAELIEWMEGSMSGTFIVLIYDQDASAKRTSEVRQEIKSKILNKYPSFHYYEVDVLDQDFQELVELIEIDTEYLKHSPALFVAADGNGFWAHGQGAVNEIAYELPQYAVELQGRAPPSTRR